MPKHLRSRNKNKYKIYLYVLQNVNKLVCTAGGGIMTANTDILSNTWEKIRELCNNDGNWKVF